MAHSDQTSESPQILRLTEGCRNRYPAEAKILQECFGSTGFGKIVHDAAGACIMTNNRVGVCRLDIPGRAGSIMLQVDPKFSHLSAFQILQTAMAGNPKDARLLSDHDLLPAPVGDDSEFHELFMIWATLSIDRFLRRSLRRDYHATEEVLNSRVKGKPLALRWVSLLASGRPHYMPCRYLRYDDDTPYNRALRAGVEVLAAYLQDCAGARLMQYVPQVQHARLALAGASRAKVSGNDVRALRYDRLTRHYAPVLRICALLLDARGTDSKVAASAARGQFAFQFDMAVAFQHALGQLLIRSNLGAVEQEPSFPYHWLTAKDQPLSGYNSLKPDFLLRRGAAETHVFDAKYKEVVKAPQGQAIAADGGGDEELPPITIGGYTLRLSRSDTYQALAYATHKAIAAKTVTFVYPVDDEAAPPDPIVARLDASFDRACPVYVAVVNVNSRGPTGAVRSFAEGDECLYNQIRKIVQRVVQGAEKASTLHEFGEGI